MLSFPGYLTSSNGAQGEPVGRLCHLEPHGPGTIAVALMEETLVISASSLVHELTVLPAFGVQPDGTGGSLPPEERSSRCRRGSGA